jgi:hypothetical protein
MKGDKKMQVTVFFDKETGAIFGSTTVVAKEKVEIRSFDVPDGEILQSVDTKSGKLITKANQISQSIALEKMQKKLELNDAKLVALGNAITEFSELLGEEGAKDEV